MISLTVFTDYNGIVLFDPERLKSFFGGYIQEDENVFEKFITTDMGDEVLKQGIIIPILAIDDGGYDIEILINEKSNRNESGIIFENGVFPLKVDGRLVIADLVVLSDWSENLGWTDVEVTPGCYEVTIRGFNEGAKTNNKCGYEIALNSCSDLPELTGTTDVNSKVFGC